MGATDLASPSPDIRRARIPVSQEGEWFVDGAETNEWFSDFSDVFKHPHSPTPERQEPARPSTAPSREAPLGPKSTFWALPPQSLVLDAPRDVTLPLNFLNVYPAILRKFPGPPIEALGRTISYLQALFTESPGFHPFITHLSTDSPPASEFVGKRVAEDLERRLIRIAQNLFSFFHGDVNIVKQYLDECPAELIPRPLFILSTTDSTSGRMSKGVHGFNNGVEGGARLWQSPVKEAVWMRHIEHVTMQENIRMCFATIARKGVTTTTALPSQQRNPLQSVPPLPPPPPQPPLAQQIVPAPQFSPQPPQFPFPPPPPNHAGQITPITPLRAPQPPQIFHVPPPPMNQMQLPGPTQVLPQPNFGTPQPPAPISAPISGPTHFVQPPPHTLPSITRSASAPGQSFKDDIVRLETQMSRLLQLVESKSRQ